jgi:cytochrome c5
MVLASVALSVGQDKAAEGKSGKAAYEEFCGKCHDLERSLKRTKDKTGWESTVERMSKYHERSGGPIPEGDRAAIVDYLVENAGK